VPELQRLRRTLISWRKEILAYFDYPITNGRTGGFNHQAKLVKKRAYGYRTFETYRLRRRFFRTRSCGAPRPGGSGYDDACALV
jgi:transposase